MVLEEGNFDGNFANNCQSEIIKWVGRHSYQREFVWPSSLQCYSFIVPLRFNKIQTDDDSVYTYIVWL